MQVRDGAAHEAHALALTTRTADGTLLAVDAANNLVSAGARGEGEVTVFVDTGILSGLLGTGRSGACVSLSNDSACGLGPPTAIGQRRSHWTFTAATANLTGLVVGDVDGGIWVTHLRRSE